MTMLTFSVEVPGNSDIERARAIIQRGIADALDEFNFEDGLLREFADWDGVRPFDGMIPVARASVYGDRLKPWQDVWSHKIKSKDRPVIMLGAKEALQKKYTRKSDYGHDVIERYLRRIRYTCFDPGEAQSFIIEVWQRVSYYTPMGPEHLYLRGHYEEDGHQVWLSGKKKVLTAQQYSYLRRLHSILRKTEKLESKMTEMAA